MLGVLRSKWLTIGAIIQEFETQFSRLTKSKYAFVVSNATETLRVARLALTLGLDDEVIVPLLTFVTTANALLYTSAEVRFADIIGPHDHIPIKALV